MILKGDTLKNFLLTDTFYWKLSDIDKTMDGLPSIRYFSDPLFFCPTAHHYPGMKGLEDGTRSLMLNPIFTWSSHVDIEGLLITPTDDNNIFQEGHVERELFNFIGHPNIPSLPAEGDPFEYTNLRAFENTLDITSYAAINEVVKPFFVLAPLKVGGFKFLHTNSKGQKIDWVISRCDGETLATPYKKD